MKLILPACTVDLDALSVVREGRTLALTPLEAALLRYLADRADRVVPRAELLEAVWSYRSGVKSRAVDNTVARVRAKIEASATEPLVLTSAHGAGYRLVLDVAQPAPPRGDLPPSPRLVGRERLAVEVIDALARPGAKLTLHGPGGVGKTALALWVAHRAHAVAERWWVDCAAARSARDVAIAVAAVLGVVLEDREPWEHVALALDGRDVLLILDDLDACSDEMVEPLTALGAARVLCTSRVEIAAGRVIEVPPLDPAAGAALLAELSGAEVGLTPEHLSVLVAQVEGLPLQLGLLAARARVMSPAELLRHARRRPSDTLSAEALGRVWYEALARLSVLPGPFSAETCFATGVGPAELEGLLRRSLVSRVGGERPRYRVFASLRDHFFADGRRAVHVAADPQHQAPSVAALQGLALGALARWYLGEGPAWLAALEGAQEPEARAWFADEHLAIAACARAAPDPNTRADLAVLLDPVLATRGPWSERLALLERARAEAPEHRGVASCLAEALGDAGRYQDAIRLGERLLDSLPGRGERGFEPENHLATSVALRLHRQLCRVGQWARARAIRAAWADADSALLWANEEARWWRGQGHAAAAERVYRQILPALHVVGRARELAEAQVGLAQVLGGTDLLEARALLSMAAETVAARGDRRTEVEVRTALGLLLVRLADWAAARVALSAADVLHRELGRPASGMVRSHLGLVAFAQGDLEGADRLFSEAVALHHAADRAASACVALANLGALRVEQGRLADAAALLERALAGLEGRGSQRVIANFQAQLAIVQSRRGDREAAELARERARGLLAGAPDPYAEAALAVADGWAGLSDHPAEVRARLVKIEAGDPGWDPMVSFFVGRLCAPLRAALLTTRRN